MQQLHALIDIGRAVSPNYLPGNRIHRLICNSFSIFTEASLRDPKFWEVIKEHAQLDQNLLSLLLCEKRSSIRREIIENIAVACSPSKLQKKLTKAVNGETQTSSDTQAAENPVRVDMLATLWGAFVKIMPQTLRYAEQSQEFFDIAHLVFHSIAEQSPGDLIYGEYLKQWSGIMLRHKTQEVSSTPLGRFLVY